MDDLLKTINDNSNKAFILERRLGRSCYLISDSGSQEKVVLKFQPESEGSLHSMWRFVFGGSLPFQNEFRTLKKIIYTEGLSFKIPNLINIHNNVFYLSSYVNQLNPKDSISILEKKKRLAASLSDFAKISRPQRWLFIKEEAFRFLESPFRRVLLDTIKASMRYNINIFKALRIIIILELRRLFNRKRVPPCMVHNDMGVNNIIVDSDDTIYIIDWEDALWEKRWPLIDITDIALNLDKGSLDKEIINYYLNKVGNRLKNLPDSLIKCHIMFGYFRSLFRALNLKRVPDCEKEILVNKINQLINIKKGAWDQWWEDLKTVN